MSTAPAHGQIRWNHDSLISRRGINSDYHFGGFPNISNGGTGTRSIVDSTTFTGSNLKVLKVEDSADDRSDWAISASHYEYGQQDIQGSNAFDEFDEVFMEFIVSCDDVFSAGDASDAIWEFLRISSGGGSQEYRFQLLKSGAIVGKVNNGTTVTTDGGGTVSNLVTAGAGGTHPGDSPFAIRIRIRRSTTEEAADGLMAIQIANYDSEDPYFRNPTWGDIDSASHNEDAFMKSIRHFADLATSGGTGVSTYFLTSSWHFRTFDGLKSTMTETEMWDSVRFNWFAGCEVRDISSTEGKFALFLPPNHFDNGGSNATVRLYLGHNGSGPSLGSSVIGVDGDLRVGWATLSGLTIYDITPNTAYSICVTANGVDSNWFNFRTLPDQDIDFNLAFTGCTYRQSEAVNSYAARAITESGLPFYACIHQGDIGYHDQKGGPIPIVDDTGGWRAYLDFHGDPHWCRMAEMMAIFYQPSDHDCDGNNTNFDELDGDNTLLTDAKFGSRFDDYDFTSAGDSGSDAGNLLTADALHTLILDRHDNHYHDGFLNATASAADGWYRHMKIGTKRFMLLDIRIKRDSTVPTAIGTAQTTWYQGMVGQSGETALIIVSPGPLGNIQTNSDNWGGLASTERNTFLTYVVDNRGSQHVLVVANDRHCSAYTDLTRLNAAYAGIFEWIVGQGAAKAYENYTDSDFDSLTGTERAYRLDGSNSLTDPVSNDSAVINSADFYQVIGIAQYKAGTGNFELEVRNTQTLAPLVDAEYGAFQASPNIGAAPPTNQLAGRSRRFRLPRIFR